MSLDDLPVLFDLKVSDTQYFYYGGRENDAWIKTISKAKGKKLESRYHVCEREGNVYLVSYLTQQPSLQRRVNVWPEDITQQPKKILGECFPEFTLKDGFYFVRKRHPEAQAMQPAYINAEFGHVSIIDCFEIGTGKKAATISDCAEISPMTQEQVQQTYDNYSVRIKLLKGNEHLRSAQVAMTRIGDILSMMRLYCIKSKIPLHLD